MSLLEAWTPAGKIDRFENRPQEPMTEAGEEPHIREVTSESESKWTINIRCAAVQAQETSERAPGDGHATG
jgi:hypothetical protein